MMRVSSLILFVLSCTLYVQCSAQNFTTVESTSKKSKKAYAEALELRNANQVAKAISKLETLLQSDPQFIEAPLTLAGIYYLQQQPDKSAQAFERAIALDSFYMPRALYSLGRIYLRSGEFAKARKLLQRYLERGSPEGDHKANTEEYFAKAKYAEYLVLHPVSFTPELLPGPINTTHHSEALPACTADGKYLIFTRKIDAQEDLYIAYWDSAAQTWISPESLDAVNTTENEGAHAISADGSMIAFTACNRRDGMGSCDIYLWQRKNGVWQYPVNAGGINSRGWDGHPALTTDGLGMYFSSDRPGGIGGRDIWYTERHGDRWTVPINLGESINTPGNEESPFLFFDNHTLYFMSDGQPGLGDSDLFMSTKTGNAWTTPKNLGYPINTIGREGALMIHPNREYAYFTSDRAGGQHDIYRFRLDSTLLPSPVSNLQGIVSDAHSSKPVGSNVIVYDLLDSAEVFRYTTDSDGRFSVAIVHGRTYGIHVIADGYAFWSGQIAFNASEPYGQKEIQVSLTPLQPRGATGVETPVVLHNIEFETGSASLLTSSVRELNLLYTLLHENPDIRIEIHGHTDNIGSAEDNQVLSESRARAVYDWLIHKNVEVARLSYKGYGESRPVASNDTEDGRQENRRTEFVIVKE